ncbi:MAG: neutral/alkaline non-lysosomal ceramidase N-terminal domain-containing protein, partial [Cyclobacteriaceae bacterium]
MLRPALFGFMLRAVFNRIPLRSVFSGIPLRPVFFGLLLRSVLFDIPLRPFLFSIPLRPYFYSILLSVVLFSGQLNAQGSNSSPAFEKGWKTGVARVIITPPEYMWMAGYAARDKPAEGKLHDLWLKALALQDAEGNTALLITSDIIGFSRDLSQSICTKLYKKFKLERKDIILSSSHTHSGPVLNNNLYGIYPPFDDKQKEQITRYQHFLEAQALIAAERALGSLASSSISTGVGISRFAVNRRETGWEGDILYNPDVKGPSDHTVPVIRI